LTSVGKLLYQAAAVGLHAKSDAVRADVGIAVAITDWIDAGRVGRSESASITLVVASIILVVASSLELELAALKVGIGDEPPSVIVPPPLPSQTSPSAQQPFATQYSPFGQ
jgi:hypothetical protein